MRYKCENDPSPAADSRQGWIVCLEAGECRLESSHSKVFISSQSVCSPTTMQSKLVTTTARLAAVERALLDKEVSLHSSLSLFYHL